ncbi:hypothetical protein GCM10012275_19100 [Longimycelium tulufanense]|uniref:Uncharacterized protein n=1 Tax=Longimycelium tulufanense TaxID=907463 RepID=A0A8J3C7A8_9PSEU|nr:hypothetical protein [Longimycelium tulufanense]GGM48235.1 hypothetical protein GCM10012275_19100 [Longimycelium tulufanense]
MTTLDEHTRTLATAALELHRLARAVTPLAYEMPPGAHTDVVSGVRRPVESVVCANDAAGVHDAIRRARTQTAHATRLIQCAHHALRDAAHAHRVRELDHTPYA